MRLLYFGIYGHGTASLHRLLANGFKPVSVVTKPDAAGQIQPVATLAREHCLPVMQPETIKGPAFTSTVEEIAPDLIVVSGYHLVLPAPVLSLPRLGAINLHGSLLPKYRGPNPHKWAIIKGETVTGVTVHRMTPRLDDGDILTQRAVPITTDDTAATLLDKLCLAGADLLAQTLPQIEAGTVQPRPQDPREASYFGYPNESDTEINWNASAAEIHKLVRGLHPHPGAWTRLDGRIVRLGRVCPGDRRSGMAPGTVLSTAANGTWMATGTEDVLIENL